MSATTPKIGLALGAGGARGLAHIGVLKVLVQAGIKIDYLAGSSMGGVIGALYACGMPPDYIEKLTDQLRYTKWMDLTVPRMGLVAGERVKEMFKLLTAEKGFDQLEIPFALVATDLLKGESVTITEGLVYEAMRASMAIPGIFPPVQKDGRMLVDGSVLDRVPVNAARRLGADLVIAVDVRFATWEPKINNAFDVILQSIELLEREVGTQAQLAADVLIQPAVDHIGTLNFHAIQECIEIGEVATQQALPRIQQLQLELDGSSPPVSSG